MHCALLIVIRLHHRRQTHAYEVTIQTVSHNLQKIWTKPRKDSSSRTTIKRRSPNNRDHPVQHRMHSVDRLLYYVTISLHRPVAFNEVLVFHKAALQRLELRLMHMFDDLRINTY